MLANNDRAFWEASGRVTMKLFFSCISGRLNGFEFYPVSWRGHGSDPSWTSARAFTNLKDPPHYGSSGGMVSKPYAGDTEH